MKQSHYPLRHENHNAKAFLPTSRIVTQDGQVIVNEVLDADYGHHLVQCANAHAELLAFVEGVAGMTKDGEPTDDDPAGWKMPIDDAYDTLATLINQGRELYGKLMKGTTG